MVKLLKLFVVGLGFSVVMGTSFAQEATSIAEAKKQVEQKCSQGCLVLSLDELRLIEHNIARALQQAYQEGLRGWSKAS